MHSERFVPRPYPRRLTGQAVRPGRLDAAARVALMDVLYPLHRQIFSGIDRAALTRYVFEPGTPHRWLLMVRDGAEVVGYCTIHVRDLTVDGRAIRVVRGAGGLLPAHRKRGTPMLSQFVAVRFCRAILTARGRPTFFAGATMSPASYRMVATLLPAMSPAPDRPPSAEELRLLHGVADALEMPPGRAGDPGVRRAGWTVRFDPATLARFRASENPAVRYFLRKNPHFTDGEGIVFMAPLRLRDLAGGVARLGHDQISRRLRAR